MNSEQKLDEILQRTSRIDERTENHGRVIKELDRKADRAASAIVRVEERSKANTHRLDKLDQAPKKHLAFGVGGGGALVAVWETIRHLLSRADSS